MDSHSTVLLTFAICGLALGIYWTKRRHMKLPPGPPQLPIIGNLLDMPKRFEWETYHQWAKELKSDIIYCNVFGVSVIILDSLQATNDLLDKRSTIYSSRPRMPMVRELMKLDWAFAIQPYGEAWRARRRIFQSAFDAKSSRQYRPYQISARNHVINRLLDSPGQWDSHFRYLSGALIMDTIYGIEVLPENDPYISAAETFMAVQSAATIPGTFLVDFLPILKYVPAWFPGAGFQTQAEEWSKLNGPMRDPPVAVVKEAMAMGRAKPSFVGHALQNIDASGDISLQETIISESAGTAYGAGSDTTGSSLSFFVLAMVKYPEVQAKAQAQLDQVLGRYQLPSFDDVTSLPYITAIVKELLRWHPITPVALPHLNIEEDNYKGYTIPANSTIIPNAWAIMHDETIYPEPFKFKPERFLKDGQLDPTVPDPSAAFGFGRRVCPGQSMARASIWIVTASILATLNIKKSIDDGGNAIEPSEDICEGFISHPLPFECNITPRSRESEKIIRMAAE